MFIAVPVGMNYRTERWPVVTFTLMGINILVWLVTLIGSLNTGGESTRWVYAHLWLIPDQSGWYAYLTSMFVHAGFLHLLGNMIYFFLFGCCVEDLLGRWRYLLFYLLGGVAADFAFIAATPLHFGSHTHLGGASGAISACMGMYLMLRPEADIEFKYFYWMLRVGAGAGEFEVPAWMAVGFWFLEDLGQMIFNIYFPGIGGGVAFAAHVGGLLAGVAFIGLGKATARATAGPVVSSGILSADEIKAASTVNRESAIAEIPTLYLHENGAQTGPFTLAQIQSRLAQNELPPETLYWCEGMTGWETVADLREKPPM